MGAGRPAGAAGSANPDCIFCRIAAGELPAEVVLETDEHVAFLDTRPVFHGHTLLIPRAHHATLPELPAAAVGPFFAEGRRLAEAVPRAMAAQGTFMAINNVVSQSVPHLHLHVVPRVRKDGLRGFFWPRTKYESGDQAAEVAARIRAAIAGS